jgi:putative spermidine/putrescine transport system ATP-binding protein
LALFPHMSVADNIAFPLRMRAIREPQVASQVRAAIELVKMSGFEQRLPSQLSGGQQQRVALARALVFGPPLLLLDEPLGALDRKLRESMQAELRSLHARLGVTIVHVTHDQTEAMAISDRIVVINKGRIEQCGTPQELYTRPSNRFVADFVGESVFLAGVVVANDVTGCHVRTEGEIDCVARQDSRFSAGDRVSVMIRPERFTLGADAAFEHNKAVGEIRSASFIGDRIRYELWLAAQKQISVTVPNRSNSTLLAPAQSVEVGWRPEDAILFPATCEH